MQAQDNVLFSGKIQEYEAAFELVDTEKKGQMPSCPQSSVLLAE